MIRTLTALLLLGPGAALAACPSGPGSISDHATAAEAAFGALDAEGFKAAVAELNEELGCSESALPPGVVAQVHKTLGLAAFLSRDLEGAKLAFQAAAAIDESLSLDATYAPEGGPLHLAWVDAQQAGPSARTDLPTEHWVDGLRASDRPRDVPYLLQRESGDTLQGAWMSPTAELPEWALQPGEGGSTAIPEPVADPVAHGASDKTAGLSPTTLQLATASGTALLLSGGLFAAALAQEGKFKSDDTLTWDERVDMQKRTNNLGFAAQGIGVVGLGLGATAVVSARW